MKFKIGDKIRSFEDTGDDITIGNIYIVTGTTNRSVYFVDDGGSGRIRPINKYELVDESFEESWANTQLDIDDLHLHPEVACTWDKVKQLEN